MFLSQGGFCNLAIWLWTQCQPDQDRYRAAKGRLATFCGRNDLQENKLNAAKLADLGTGSPRELLKTRDAFRRHYFRRLSVDSKQSGPTQFSNRRLSIEFFFDMMAGIPLWCHPTAPWGKDKHGTCGG
jgi:hypothetical protein